MLIHLTIVFVRLVSKLDASPVTLERENGVITDEDEKMAPTPDNVMSIAAYLKKDPRGPFDPQVLRALVTNPESLKMLPKEVLGTLVDDQIFSVNVPTTLLDQARTLLDEMKEAVVAKEEAIPNYEDYYDYDYSSDTDDMIGSFLSDLDPEFLKKLSPDLILAYFENASSSDVEAILSNSGLLKSLPIETMAEVLKKLPEDLLIVLANSEGVKELFTKTKPNIAVEEKNKFDEIQNVLANELVGKLTTKVIIALPDYLLRSQLNNVESLKTVLKHHEKLKVLVEKNPHLLNEISNEVIKKIISTERNILGLLPTDVLKSFTSRDELFGDSEFLYHLLDNNDDEVLETLLQDDNVANALLDIATNVTDEKIYFFERLLKSATITSRLMKIIPCSVLLSMSESFNPKIIHLADQHTLLNVVKTRPHIVDCVSGETIKYILGEFSEDISESTITSVISSFPEGALWNLANNRVIIENIPPSFVATAVKTLPKHLMQRLTVHSNLLSYLPNSSFGILLEQPEAEALIGSLFPSELASVIRQNPRLLELEKSSSKLLSFISTGTIIDLASREDILKLLPINIVTDLFITRPELVTQIPTSVALQLIRDKPEAIEKIPLQFLKSLVLRKDILNSLTETDASSLVTNLSLNQLKFLGEDESIMLNLPHRFIVTAAKTRPQLISTIHPTILMSLAQSSFILENMPVDAMVAAANQMSDGDMLDIIDNNAHLLSRLPVTTMEALLKEPRVADIFMTLSPTHLSLIVKQNLDLFDPSIYPKIIPHISGQALVRISLVLSEMDDVLALVPNHVFIHLINHRADIVRLTPPSVVVKLLRSKPDILIQLPLRTLRDLASKRSDVIFELTEDDLSSLVRIKPDLILTAPSLPSHALVTFLDNNVGLINLLPQSAFPYLSLLTKDTAFVGRIPTRLYAKLAEVGASVVDRILDKDAVILTLTLHPDLPAIVNPSKVTPFLLSFLEDSAFIERLPCPAIVAATRAPELLNRLSDETLDKLATSTRILKCVPGDILEDLMESPEIQSRLGISTMLRGARNLPLRKMSLSLAYTFLSSQVAQTHEMLTS